MKIFYDCELASLKLRWIAWLITMVVLGHPLESSAAIQKQLEVSRNAPIQLTTMEVDTILQNATTVLQTKDGVNDVACSVAMSRNGTVKVFGAPEIINSEADFLKLAALPGRVKMVSQINWCGQLLPNIKGCAPIPGKFMLVVRFAGDQEGILWLHEYGHNKGLNHRNDTSAVMNPTLASNRRSVNAAECAAYQKP